MMFEIFRIFFWGKPYIESYRDLCIFSTKTCFTGKTHTHCRTMRFG